MSLPINYQNTVNKVKVPFPPSISVDEIVQVHLKNGIINVNRTMNAFMIYRKEYNHIVAKFNPSSKDVSKFVSSSWQNEPEYVKDYYRQMAKNVKKCFKKKVPSLFFINSNLAGINDNHVSLETSNLSLHNIPLNTDQNTTYSDYSMDQDAIYSNTLVSDDLKNAYMTMNDNELMNFLSEDMVLTYNAIIQSLPL